MIMTQEQHYRTELDEAIALYKNREIPARYALKLYFRIRFAPGWDGIVDYGAIRELFEMARSTFYRVLRRLVKDGEVAISQQSGRRIRRVSCNGVGGANDSDDGFDAGEKPSTGGVGFEPKLPQKSKRAKSRFARRCSASLKSEVKDAYRLFLEGLSIEQRRDFEAFCHRKVELVPFPLASSTAWLNKHYGEYWVEFERNYANPNAPVAAPNIPQKLKEALATGKVRLERYFSRGEFLMGVFSLDGKGWFNSIEEWLASC